MTNSTRHEHAKTMHVACAADEKYIAHTATMLHSLWFHNRHSRVVVHFLHLPNLNISIRRQLASMTDKLGLELHWVSVEEALMEGLSGRGYIPPVVWYRVFMPQLLPDIERVIYLDSDIVIADSIAPLWELELDGYYFAAVTNAVPEYFSGRAEKLGIPGAQHYFNAGVAVWNLALLRTTDFVKSVLAYWHEHKDRLLWLEQDVLNVLYHHKRLILHPRWNCQNGIFYSSWGICLFEQQEIKEAIANPAVIHFEGGSWAKPWHYLSPHPLRSRYWFHRKHTPWSRRIPEGVTLRNVAKKYLPSEIQVLLRRLLGT